MASGQQTISKAIKHPDLGPADAVFGDRNKSLGSLFLWLAFFCLGPLGVLMGLGDFAGGSGGSSLLGVAYVAGGIVLGLYSAWSVYQAANRLRNRVALIVARDGFEAPNGDGPVRWDEVDTISDPASPPGRPQMVRVQLVDPDDYAERHSLGAFARYLLRSRQGDLFLGRDMAMPVADVQALMRKRLAESGRLTHDGADDATSASGSSARGRSESGGRKPGGKR